MKISIEIPEKAENLNNVETQALNIHVVSGSFFDDKIDEWHNNKENNLKLHEYLGLTIEEYGIWLKNPDEIERNYR